MTVKCNYYKNTFKRRWISVSLATMSVIDCNFKLECSSIIHNDADPDKCWIISSYVFNTLWDFEINITKNKILIIYIILLQKIKLHILKYITFRLIFVKIIYRSKSAYCSYNIIHKIHISI